MNCANHPDIPVAAYCQFCGKPLCAQCSLKINNVVGCEPCLAARLGASVQGAGVQFTQTPEGMYATDGKGGSFSQGPGFQNFSAGPPPGSIPPQGSCAHPGYAFWLGWIPGVGAMYNGQFAKAMVHVFVFAILVDISNHEDAFGILVAAWIFYQVFDAYQTAVARRDGLPLPNPFGLNDVGQWFGIKNSVPYAGANPFPPTPVRPAAGATGPDPSAPPMGSSSGFAANAPGALPFTQPVASSYDPSSIPPVPPDQVDMPELRRGVPTGAVVLIILGVAFLLGNMGIFSDYWLERGWPLLLIGLGVWLVIRRSQTPPTGGVR